MIKHFILVMLVFVGISGDAQPFSSSTPSTTKTDYLKKSKSQKTIAWVLMGNGVVLVSTGFVIGMSQSADILFSLFDSSDPEQPSNTADVLFFSGLASMAGSIPFFIGSSKNKKKANQVAVLLKTENFTSFRYQFFKQISYPALSVKISL